MSRVTLALDDYYEDLQGRFPTRIATDYSTLVVPNGNAKAPIHRWFHMKEAYSCLFVETILDRLDIQTDARLSVCDPFLGSGTTGVSLVQAVSSGRIAELDFTGLETNPFLYLVGETKIRAVLDPPRDFGRTAQRVAALAKQRRIEPAAPPELSTFANPQFFDPATLEELLLLKAAIASESDGGASPVATDLARLCLGSIVEPCSRLRRDGRALRHQPNKPSVRPIPAFLSRAERIEEDLCGAMTQARASVHQLDARVSGNVLRESGPFSHVLFSPPYPNNIDYTEVYKLEAWLLGLFETQTSFRDQRWRTLRSHASLDFGHAPVGLNAKDRAAVDDLVKPVLTAAEDRGGRYSASRARTIRGYMYDMLETLKHVSSATEIGGSLVYVVGNSLHGGRDTDGVLIAADILIAGLAEQAGFVVDQIEVARSPARRRSRSPYLRESLVFATRRS